MITCMLVISPVLAEDLVLHVQDSDGQALENAVVLLPGAADAVPNDIAIMDQIDKRFVPPVLIVQQGQQVLFPNSDNIRHHVYSFSPAKTFEIKLYAGVPEAPVVFDTAGVVVLGCNIHDAMVGYIVVADTPHSGLSDRNGRIQLAVATRPTAVRLWHPRLAAVSAAALTIPLPAADERGVITLTLDATAPAVPVPASTFGNRFKKPHGQ